MTSNPVGTTTTEDEFALAVRRIAAAGTPFELFGDGRAAAREYRRLARLVHPDRVAADPASDRRSTAQAAFARLASLWRAHAGEPLTGSVAYRGDLTELYTCQGRGRRSETVLLKVPRDPANNDLLRREALALGTVEAGGDRRYLPYLPRLVESVRHRDPGTGVERQVNMLATPPGLRSLVEVGQAYPRGLEPRDGAWMWRRLLVALGTAHRAGVVHGAVLPDHVLVEPAEHGVVLVDWCYAAIGADDRVPALVPRYADWYPREVTARGQVGPGTDIAMATRCMTDLIGEHMPRPLARFADGCRLRPLSHRPDDAWRLLSELDEVLERCFGPRRFRPFHLPPRHG